MKKNTLKLPEEIGKGINKEHLEKVVKARNMDAVNNFKSKEIDKLNFEKVCNKLKLNKSLVLRELMNNFTKENEKNA